MSSDVYLDQHWPSAFQPFPQRLSKFLQRTSSGARYGHASRQLHPIEIGTADLKHTQGARPRIADTEIAKLALEDSIRAVGENHSGDFEAFPRHSPPRLRRVHGAAISR